MVYIFCASSVRFTVCAIFKNCGATRQLSKLFPSIGMQPFYVMLKHTYTDVFMKDRQQQQCFERSVDFSDS